MAIIHRERIYQFPPKSDKFAHPSPPQPESCKYKDCLVNMQNPQNPTMQSVNPCRKLCREQGTIWDPLLLLETRIFCQKNKYMIPTTMLSKGNYDESAAVSFLKRDLAQDFFYLILFWTQIAVRRKSLFSQSAKSQNRLPALAFFILHSFDLLKVWASDFRPIFFIQSSHLTKPFDGTFKAVLQVIFTTEILFWNLTIN